MRAPGWKHVDVAAVRIEPPQDVPLDAEVIGRDAPALLGPVLRRDAEFLVIGVAGIAGAVAPLKRVVAGDALHEIRAFHPRNRARLLHQLGGIDIARSR